jgi:hypothetical protein
MPQSQPTSAIPQAQQAPSASTGPPAGANTCAEKTGTHIRNNCNYQIAVVIAAFQLGRDSFSLYPMSPGSSAPVPSNARIVAMCNVNMAQGHGAYLNGSNYGCR